MIHLNIRTNRLLKYFNVSVLNAVIGVISSAVLTRVFEKGTYGQISFFTSATAVLFSLTCMGLDSAFMRFYYEVPGNDTKSSLYKKNIILVSLIFIAYSISLFFFRQRVAVLFEDTSILVFIAFLNSTFSQILLRFSNLYFRMSEAVNLYALQSISSQICSKLLIVIGILISTQFSVIIAINSFLVLLIAIGWSSVVRKKFGTNNMEAFVFSLKGYGEYIKYALFAFPIDLIFYLNTYISQYIIINNLDVEMLGEYSALSIFISAISVFKIGFNNFWNPFVYKNYKQKRETIMYVHSLMLLLCVIIESSVLVFSDVIYLILGKSYRTNKEILGFLILSQVLLILQETTAYGTLLKKKSHINLGYSIIYVAIKSILCWFLSLQYGINGVAISDAIAGICLFFMGSFFGQLYYRTIYSYSKSFLSIVLICLIPVMYFFLYNNLILQTLLFTLIGLIVYLINMSSINEFVKMEFRKEA